jgi:hypothetical protein
VVPRDTVQWKEEFILNLDVFDYRLPHSRLKGALTLTSRILDRLSENLQSYLRNPVYKKNQDLICNERSFEQIIKKISDYSNEPYSVEKQLKIIKTLFLELEDEIRFSIEDFEKVSRES